MKNKFKEYNQYTKTEFKNLWDNSLFVLDTNTLLNMYRYSRETVKIYFNILEQLKEKNQLWIPYQVGYEFHNNRIDVISEYEGSYTEILKIIENAKNDIKTKYKDHPFLDLDKINKKVRKGLSGAESYLKQEQKKHPKWLENDDILEKINNLFKDNIGDNYTDEEMIKIKEEGKERYAKKIPPGFKDIKKDENKRYGDLILWNQIIDKAKEINKSIIFISGDVKEDWWLEKNGKKLMPLPQLKKELLDKAGVDFHIYTSDRFLKLSKDDINNKIIKEVRKVRELEEEKIQIRRRVYQNDTNYTLKNYIIYRKQFLELMNEILNSKINDKDKNELITIFTQLDNASNKHNINKVKRYLREFIYILKKIIYSNKIDAVLYVKIKNYINKLNT